MNNNASLPFELSTESLAGWLHSLSTLPPANAANQLNQTLKQLARCDAVANELLPLLLNLSPLTLHLSNSLINIARAEGQAMDTGKSGKIVKLSIQLLRHLSLVFCQVVENRQLAEAQAQSAIFHALQLIGHCQRNSALFYEVPSATLWKKTALLYTMAAKRGWLQAAVSSKLQEFKVQATIAAVIKRNLLFAICAPGQYAAADIPLLFRLANQAQHLLEIGPDLIHDADFYWELGDSEPCPPKTANWQPPRGLTAIKTQDLGHALQMGEIGTDLPPVSQARLILRLTGYAQLFASVDMGPPQVPAHLLAGYARVCTYLQGQDKLSRIMRLGAQPTSRRNAFSDVSLVPLEHEKSFYKPINTQPSFTDQGTDLNLLRSHSKQFLVTESASPNCFNGDIGMLCREQQAARLVIVRQQSRHEDVTLLLLEPIAGDISIYEFGNQTEQAIVVGAETEHPDVFLPKGKYALDSKISLNHGPTLNLKACLEHNAYFARFRVSFDS